MAARLVYPGNRYKYGSDGDISATVLRWDVAKFMMLHGAYMNHEIESADANAAFMNGVNTVEEYAHMPEGHGGAEIPVDERFAHLTDVKQWAFLIVKMWYGKENAPKEWQNIRDADMVDTVTGHGYVKSMHNDSLFKAPPGTKGEHKIGILVDDFLSVGEKEPTDKFMKKIAGKWSMRVFGDIHGHEFMGVRVHRDRDARVIEFDQERAIINFLKDWEMDECKGRDGC